ncbi:hypothetical protein ACF1BN_17675 [Streptomyces sp. NPDC014861]|uniref:hypothetical protein n=1 Tax=Streptomyces sp. NPDC014861 TaxID=3364923 RepID=UPI0036F7DA5D
MRGDDTQPTVAKSGPRHAAPRKTLLNRIQGPAGKAMAFAAMPTAVLMGMGLAPSPALADEKDIPFAPGPCVTRSDEPVAEETTATPTAKATETAKPEPTATATEPSGPSGEPTATPSATATASPSATAGPGGTASPEPTATTSASDAGQGGAQEAAPAADTAPTTAAPTPTPTKSVNPLDPLGVGDSIKDFFDGLAPKEEPTATPSATPSATATPSPSATTAAPRQKPATADDTPATQAPATRAPATEAPSTGTPATGAPGAKSSAADRTKAAIEEVAGKAGVPVEELPESAQGLDAKPDTDIPDGAKPRFPCPERDDAALAAAEVEPGIPLLPDAPWRLESTKLTLSGLKYHGIVEVKTYGGQVKKVLKFTATSIKIKDLHQITEHSEGREGHVRSRKGTESTITDGTVTMYTEELKGNLLGIIPITFGPESPPPLDLPVVFFTNVKLKQAGQFGGTLRVQQLRNTVEPA